MDPCVHGDWSQDSVRVEVSHAMVLSVVKCSEGDLVLVPPRVITRNLLHRSVDADRLTRVSDMPVRVRFRLHGRDRVRDAVVCSCVRGKWATLPTSVVDGWIEATGVVTRDEVQYSLGVHLDPHVTVWAQPCVGAVLVNATDRRLLVDDKSLSPRCARCGLSYTYVHADKVKVSDGSAKGEMTVTPEAITIVTDVQRALNKKKRPSLNRALTSCMGFSL